MRAVMVMAIDVRFSAMRLVSVQRTLALKNNRNRLTGQASTLLQHRRMHPSCLRMLDPIGRHVPLEVTLRARERSRSELPRLSSKALHRRPGRDPRHRLRNDPIPDLFPHPSWQRLLCDLSQAAISCRDKVSGRKNLDVDDGLNAVKHVMRVDLAGDLLLTDAADIPVQRFVYDSWRNMLANIRVGGVAKVDDTREVWQSSFACSQVV